MISAGSGFYWDTANPTPQIKMTLSSGVLTVSCEGVCKVLFEKQGTPGDIIELDLSGRSWTISDDSADDEFLGAHGVTNSVLWVSAMPWFAYLVNKDNTAANVKLGLSRDPTKGTTPAATNNIGYISNAAVTSAQGNLFLAHTANAGYNGVPCQLVGAVTATSTSQAGTEAGYKWTFGTLTAGRDGIGNMALTRTFATKWTMPVGQNGAIESTFFYVAGGDLSNDVPKWTTDQGDYFYYLDASGSVSITFTTQGAGAVASNGDVAAVLKLALPYSIGGTSPSTVMYKRAGLAVIGAAPLDISAKLIGSLSTMELRYLIGSNVNANDFAGANDDIWLAVDYKMFD